MQHKHSNIQLTEMEFELDGSTPSLSKISTTKTGILDLEKHYEETPSTNWLGKSELIDQRKTQNLLFSLGTQDLVQSQEFDLFG